MERIQARLNFTLLPVLAVSVLLLLLPSLQATHVKYCDKDADYAVKVKDVVISPNPVVRGKPATFKILGSTGESISGGKLLIDVKYFGVHIHQETHDFCEETSCPVSGNFELSHSQSLPAFTPPGSYTLTMIMSDKNGDELTCISFDFKIRIGSSVSDS
ncbi:putative phosphatidylglycerol/phosphatidylinositol transfer protein DDB_G0282107 [Carica papaya]|uniref:putative phosphatidylglycerol/phosphatidylinositol transfer protein DDB_G0282107 n=1 Tax=Carica papaya TaxID=3649 RepID=UPI000B8CA1C2|nr:putative phosphatidylglycerol/phosphatidylinositol transfer protein DDB_G0282107 [Carica papaya]